MRPNVEKLAKRHARHTRRGFDRGTNSRFLSPRIDSYRFLSPSRHLLLDIFPRHLRTGEVGSRNPDARTSHRVERSDGEQRGRYSRGVDSGARNRVRRRSINGQRRRKKRRMRRGESTKRARVGSIGASIKLRMHAVSRF